MRFDFTAKGALTVGQVKEAEEIANRMVLENHKVYAKDSELALAKAVQGLRAVFDEFYPDPVRVVSIGVPVEDLLQDPSGPAGSSTSVEFCGGTHLHRSGHVGNFVISSEEAIAKGIRRIVALTGPEATKALKKAEVLQNELNKLRDVMSGEAITEKELTRKIVELNDDVSHATIPHWRKDELRSMLKDMKKILDDKDRARKAAVIVEVGDQAKSFIEANPDQTFVVHEFQAGSNAKALDGALKQFRSLSPKTAVMLFSVDSDANKIICLSSVPKPIISKGLRACDWVQHVSGTINGKGGGKEETAQATGTNPKSLAEAMKLASEFAQLKLSN